jgi:hypothetical protein
MERSRNFKLKNPTTSFGGLDRMWPHTSRLGRLGRLGRFERAESPRRRSRLHEFCTATESTRREEGTSHTASSENLGAAKAGRRGGWMGGWMGGRQKDRQTGRSTDTRIHVCTDTRIRGYEDTRIRGYTRSRR